MPGLTDARVTVVIPARNEEDHIGACLDSVLAQELEEQLQVIVVDGDSTDATADIVRARAARDGRVELIHNPRGTIPVSLNLALAAARGSWLVRVDGHATLPQGYVARTVGLLRTGNWGGVGGRKEGVGTTPCGRAIAAAMRSPFGVGNSTYHYGSTPQVVEHVPFGAYPTQLARDLGGWNERLPVNQDFEFDYRVRRAGYELLFDPELVIDWQCRQTIGALFRQYRRYGRGKADVVLLHPQSARLRHGTAPALVASWAFAVVLLPRRLRLAVALMAPYAVAVAAAGTATARSLDDRRARPYVAPAFVTMHAGWGIGFWAGMAHAAGPALRARLTGRSR